jgi:hypothetical protein
MSARRRVNVSPMRPELKPKGHVDSSTRHPDYAEEMVPWLLFG